MLGMRLWQKLELFAPLGLGVAGYLVWFSWNLFPLAAVFFMLSMASMLFSIVRAVFRGFALIGFARTLFFGLVIAALSHAVGMFLPEVGFDALWYHLPLTRIFLLTQEWRYIPELYQSAMPQLGSMLFVFPYMLAQVFGVKIFTFLITLFTMVVFFRLARGFLSRNIALLTVLIFFLFHAVAWQASSAYVDQLRLLFELTALVVMGGRSGLPQGSERAPQLQRPDLLAGVLLGFSLATKLLSLFFLPAFFAFALLRRGWRTALLVGITALFVASPWYLTSYRFTGNPVYPLFASLDGKEQLANLGYSGWAPWIVHQFLLLPILPVVLGLHTESPTTPLFLFAIPFLLTGWKTVRKLLPFAVFALISLVIFLFIPPPSVRYVLSGLAIALLVCVRVIWDAVRARPKRRAVFLLACYVSLAVNLSFRLGANLRALPYLLGQESQAQYIERFSSGLAKGPTSKWYTGYWETYGR